MDICDRIRSLCAALLAAPPDSAEAARYRFELSGAIEALAAEQRNWNKTSEPDEHQDEARQSYGSRESDSADAFAEGLKLFNPNKGDSDKKKDE